MLGSSDIRGDAMCAVDGCPQHATATPHRVHIGRAQYVWLRFCHGCAVELRTVGFLRERSA
jgi:hypothetical protein